MNDKTFVVLGYGPQSLDFLSKASKLFSNGAVLSPTVARMAGANIAVGHPDALEDLINRLSAGAVKHEQERLAGSGLSDNAILWLATGRRGLSSNTLFTFVTGFDAEGDHGHNYPHDPDDLSRCRKLLEQCPELVSCLPRVAAAGAEWAALVPRWEELCALMDDEAPEWRLGRGRGPKTYALMKEFINGARAQ